MTTTDSTALTEDPVQETARLARVHVQYGELRVPIRVLAHLTDGPVSVRLIRGEDEPTQCAAELRTMVGASGEYAVGKLTGIEWPVDVEPGTRVTVMCARGGAAGHEVGVLLPPLPEPMPFDLDEKADVQPFNLDEVEAAESELPVRVPGESITERTEILARIPPAERTATLPITGKLDVPEQGEPPLLAGRVDDEDPSPWDELPVWPGDEPVVENDAPIGDDEFGMHAEEPAADERVQPQPSLWRRGIEWAKTNARVGFVALSLGAAIGITVTWLVMGR